MGRRREEKRSVFCFSLFGFSEVRAVNVLNLKCCLMVTDYQKSLCIDLSQLVWEQFTVLQNGGQNMYVLGEGSLRETPPQCLLISHQFEEQSALCACVRHVWCGNHPAV